VPPHGEILLAVDASSRSFTADDAHPAWALTAASYSPVPVLWGRDVPEGATVVIRSTWDYVERPEAFAAWLDLLDARGAVVHNPTELLRWNTHKRYLLDLADAGVPIVPTVLVPAGASCSVPEVMQRGGWDDAVAKPAVGGTARLAATSRRGGVAALQRHLDRVAEREDVLLQPYVRSIEQTGEYSVIVVGGTVQLTVRKAPSGGEWRVQSDFGGTAEVVTMPDSARPVVERTLAALPLTPTYARLDVVLGADEAPQIMECELVEPELFFRMDPALAAAFIDELKR